MQSVTQKARAGSHQTTNTGAMRARLHDLDRSKGLAILLVVFGHLVARQDPPGVNWYEPARIAVYLFHMPFFMYLSGYVTFYSGAARVKLRDWPLLARRRAVRLLLPFLAFGLLILWAKLLAAHVADVDNVPPDLWLGLRALVWDTQHSPAISIWYIGVLFVYCVVTPLILSLPRGEIWLACVGFAVYLLPAPPIVYADRVCTYFVFFVAGGLAAEAGQAWTRLIDAVFWPALALLAALIFVVASGRVSFTWSEGAQGFPYKWWLLAAGLASLPAVHGLMRTGWSDRAAVLEQLGRYSFVIYLLNTPFIGASKAMLLKLTTWDGSHFIGFAVAMMLAGTLGPIAAKRLVFRRLPWFDRLTD